MEKYKNEIESFLFNFNSKNSCESTGYSDYGSLFLFSNELLRECPKEKLDNKSILTLTASGDHIISNILQDANNITAFDINKFAKYYVALKLAMIKTYDYNKFINLLHTSYVTRNYLNENGKVIETILSDVKNNLTKDEILFWKTYINICFNHPCRSFRRLYRKIGANYNIYNSLYSDDKYYKELKSRLKYINISYIDSDLFALKENTNKNFDFIYLGNLLGCMGNKDQAKSLDYLYDLLGNDGSIYAYGEVFNNFLPTEHSVGNRYSQQVTHTSDGMAYYSKYTKKGK